MKKQLFLLLALSGIAQESLPHRGRGHRGYHGGWGGYYRYGWGDPYYRYGYGPLDLVANTMGTIATTEAIKSAARSNPESDRIAILRAEIKQQQRELDKLRRKLEQDPTNNSLKERIKNIEEYIKELHRQI